MGKKPIFLIGYMCSGKTTLGKALADSSNLDFIDLDDFIEQKAGCSISEIFKRDGEGRFRELEQESLHEVSDFQDCIISCGGGTPCFFDNMDHMNRSGLTVFLDADESTLIRRLLLYGADRPLVSGKSISELQKFIEMQLADRKQYYEKAAAIWNTDKLDNEKEIEENVIKFRNQFAI